MARFLKLVEVSRRPLIGNLGRQHTPLSYYAGQLGLVNGSRGLSMSSSGSESGVVCPIEERDDAEFKAALNAEDKEQVEDASNTYMALHQIHKNTISGLSQSALDDIDRLSQEKANRTCRPVFMEPMPGSTVRRVVFPLFDDETKEEKEWRNQWEDIMEWQHEYWKQNNRSFHEMKAQYASDDRPDWEFYRDWVTHNRDRMVEYNVRWRRLNYRLVIPAIKAEIRRAERLNKRGEPVPWALKALRPFLL